MTTGAHMVSPMFEVEGAPARAISISKMYLRLWLQPVPPYSSGQSGAIQPLSCSRLSHRTWPALSMWAFFDWAMRARMSSSKASSMKARTSSRKARSSLLKARSMVPSPGQTPSRYSISGRPPMQGPILGPAALKYSVPP